jgi:hypothetical protein
VSAKQAEVTASAAYARALVEFDRATGATLDSNGIAMADALAGHVDQAPTPSMLTPSTPESKQ